MGRKRNRPRIPDDARICPWCNGSGLLAKPWPRDRQATICWCCKGIGRLDHALQPLT